MKKTFDAAIIGGGIIGCSIAYQLARRGKSVVVIEQDTAGAQASGASGGMLGAQVEMEGPGPMAELALKSRRLFPSLISDLQAETGIDIEWNQTGMLKVALNEKQREHLQHVAKWQREVGEKADWLEPEEVRKLEPALSPDIAGAVSVPDDTQLSAPRLTAAFAAAAALYGAVFAEKCRVHSFIHDANRITGIKLDRPIDPLHPNSDEILAEDVVLAAGAWSGQLAAQLGISLPVRPVKGECLFVHAIPAPVKKTIFTHGCYLVPKAGGKLLVGSTMKEQGFDDRVTVDGLRHLTERAMRIIPAFANLPVEKIWAGLRPATPDGHPYIGKAENGLLIATGHLRNGILLSPITGKIIADLACGKEPEVDLAPFSPLRAANR